MTSRTPGAGFPPTLEIESIRLLRRSWDKVSQIRALAAERIGGSLGCVSAEELSRVVDGLREVIGD